MISASVLHGAFTQLRASLTQCTSKPGKLAPSFSKAWHSQGSASKAAIRIYILNCRDQGLALAAVELADTASMMPAGTVVSTNSFNFWASSTA